MLRFCSSLTARNTRRDAGDTLIEVLFAVAVFSLIVVTSLTLMNQGISAAQRSLEITSVRQQMDGQVEALRFLHEAYVQAYEPGQVYNFGDGVSTPAEEYARLINFASTTGARSFASPFNGSAACAVSAESNKNFVINPVCATFVSTSTSPAIEFQLAQTSAQPVYSSSNTLSASQGMWLEAVRPATSNNGTGFIDFHVRACWDVPGSDKPMNLGTIVRLYEPRA